MLTGHHEGNVHLFTRSSSLPRLFSAGETVIVSSDSDLAFSQGVVLSVDDSGVTVMLDRDLRLGKGSLFHLDRHEFQGSMSSNLVNLVRLMSPSALAERLRRLVVDRASVSFLKGLSRNIVDVGKHILRPLNRVQQKAVFKVLMAEEYVLLKGMPGTGKTTLIVAIVRLLAALGKTVLLASYT
jgi:DNA replication ATP-dependent helicase Dna2